MEINTGPLADYTLSGTKVFNGDTMPPDLHYDTNQIFIVWSTDVNIILDGWSFNYTSGKFCQGPQMKGRKYRLGQIYLFGPR